MKCPGQDMQYWKPGAIFDAKCPECGHTVEFFKDDTARKCDKCGHRFANPKLDFGCAAYCQYAEQCLGTLPPEIVAQQQNLLKDRVAIEMKRYFKSDFKRISHATRTARHAERIGQNESGSNLAVILVAAYLHDIGIPESLRKHNSSAAKFHQVEGPPVAEAILTKLGAQQELIDEVCAIIRRHHHPDADGSTDFKVVYDADRITNIEDLNKEKMQEPAEIIKLIDSDFLTESGRQEARKTFGLEE